MPCPNICGASICSIKGVEYNIPAFFLSMYSGRHVPFRCVDSCAKKEMQIYCRLTHYAAQRREQDTRITRSTLRNRYNRFNKGMAIGDRGDVLDILVRSRGAGRL